MKEQGEDRGKRRRPDQAVPERDPDRDADLREREPGGNEEQVSQEGTLRADDTAPGV